MTVSVLVACAVPEILGGVTFVGSPGVADSDAGE
jgi:hypothetical protein